MESQCRSSSIVSYDINSTILIPILTFTTTYITDTDSLVFKPYGHQDDSWGVDDFIALKDLHNRELEMTYMNFYAPVEVLKTEEEEGEGGGDTENKDNEKKEEKEKEKEKIAGVAESKTQGEIKPKKETDKEKEKAPKSPGKHNRRTMRQRQKQEEHDEKSKKLEVQLQPMTDENGKRITDRLVLEIQMLSFGEVMLKQHPFTQVSLSLILIFKGLLHYKVGI